MFIRTGTRYALGYFLVGCCFGVGAYFTSGTLRIILIVPTVFFVLVAAWCGLIYGMLGGAFKVAERVSSAGWKPEIRPSKQREMFDRMFPLPTPSLRDRLLRRKIHEEPVANLASEAEALEWARSHLVGYPGRRGKQGVDLRLTPGSLPTIAALLGTSDGDLLMTAFAALGYNGAQVDSDATAAMDPTVYRVTMPNGAVLTVPVESP